MIRFPNCKINLGLYITHKRDDGYHDLETVFYPVPLHDALEIIASQQTSLHLSGLAVAGDTHNNLAWKAYELLQKEFPDRVKNVDIYLHKAIPMGAGMGGGSADGAFMLRLLNDFYELGLTDMQLAEHALQLGSDCPFFIYNTPHFATGRGEQMQPINIDLSAYSIQLICPQVHISTAAAFGIITPKAAAFDLRGLAQLPIAEWKDHISNDFEVPVFEQHPALAAIKEQLYSQGAVYAAMSGSGSTIYGIFPKEQKATIAVSISFTQHYIV